MAATTSDVGRWEAYAASVGFAGRQANEKSVGKKNATIWGISFDEVEEIARKTRSRGKSECGGGGGGRGRDDR